jgi:lysozyme family protein
MQVSSRKRICTEGSMATSNFNECLRRLLAHEGGYTHHPSDPGGPTNFGITIADYRRYAKPGATAADVKAMRVDEAKAIYKAKYWDALRCDELPAGVDDSVFDYGVNSGVARSGKVLRRVLGLPDSNWRVTAEVLDGLAARAPKAVIAALNDERLRFLQSLRTWPVFGAGWSRRVKEVRAFSLALAASSSASSSAVRDADEKDSSAPSSQRVPPLAGPMTGSVRDADEKDSSASKDVRDRGATNVARSAPPAGKGEIPATSGAQTGAAGGAVVVGGAAATRAGQNGADPVTIAAIVVAALIAAAAVWSAVRWWRRRRQQRALPGTGIVLHSTD